jgi:hypothetical protein
MPTSTPTYVPAAMSWHPTFALQAIIRPPTNFPTVDFSYCFALEIHLSTDAFGEETSLFVYQQDNDTIPVYSWMSFESNTTYDLFECLDPHLCYYFVIKDEFDDGICCDQGRGNYSVSVNEKVIGQGGKFAESETVMIGGDCGMEPDEARCQESYTLLNVTVKADENGFMDNTWAVLSTSTNQTLAVNNYDLGPDARSQLRCIPDEQCYIFWMIDIYKDGWQVNDTFWMV